MEKILKQKHEIQQKKGVLNEINKENLKLIAQKKKLTAVVSSFQAQNHNQDTISHIQLQSQEDIQLEMHNSMSQHIFEQDEWMNIQR